MISLKGPLCTLIRMYVCAHVSCVTHTHYIFALACVRLLVSFPPPPTPQVFFPIFFSYPKTERAFPAKASYFPQERKKDVLVNHNQAKVLTPEA